MTAVEKQKRLELINTIEQHLSMALKAASNGVRGSATLHLGLLISNLDLVLRPKVARPEDLRQLEAEVAASDKLAATCLLVRRLATKTKSGRADTSDPGSMAVLTKRLGWWVPATIRRLAALRADLSQPVLFHDLDHDDHREPALEQAVA